MEIRILDMRLRNFKGVRDFSITFEGVTVISGDNATGKSTIFDAFTWLLFGKNSRDEKEFNIKTLDENNNALHKLEHEVSAKLDVDGRHVTLKRIFKEKWTKKKGALEAELTGHETEFFVDDVPLNQRGYQARVDFILNEEKAKLITNPLYFNQMKWQDRRRVLESMAGTITNEQIAGSNVEFQKLIATLGSATLIDFKKKISAQKNKIKDTLTGIPTRIDEVDRSKPDPENYEALASEIAGKQAGITDIDSLIEGKTQEYQTLLDGIRAKQQELSTLKTKLERAEWANKSTKQNRLTEVDDKIKRLKQLVSHAESDIQLDATNAEKNAKRLQTLHDANALLRARWNFENEKELIIDPSNLKCPTCKQALPEADRNNVESRLTNNFNTSKASVLKQIEDEGVQNKATIETLKATNTALKEHQQILDKQVTEWKQDIVYQQQQRTEIEGQEILPTEEMVSLQEQITNFVIPDSPVINNTDLRQQKSTIMQDIDALKVRLGTKELIAKAEQRIKELSDEESKLSQELADLERTEFTIDAFSKTKIETIESRINGKFRMVKFKMFRININGGEEECCDTLVDGVPYSDVNTAGKINAGIDIINALTEYYNVNAPVWIDNRESIIRILPCRSQIINLVAVKDAKLTVTSQETTELALTLN